MKDINLSLSALRKAYESGALTPRQVIQQCRSKALQYEDSNAWIYLLSEDELAPYLASLENNAIESLPLYGVPFAIKDNIDLAGVPTTAACPDFTYVAKTSAKVVELLIQAGAIPLGKTNLDQFATGLVGTRSPYGEGKNVFNPDYISGGSSAGSAIACASGQVSFSLGTDTAGSGRVPAVLNNLIGLKPSKGLLSTSGVVPACKSLDCVSIFALNAGDAAKVFNVAAQYDSNDPYARKNQFYNLSRYFSGTAPKSFRFAIPAQLDFQGNSETKKLFGLTVEALESIGGKVECIDFQPFMDAAKLLYEGPWVAERWLATQGVDLDSMHPVIKEIIGNGNNALASDAFAAQYKLQAAKKVCDSALADFDFILTPTTPTIYTRAEIAEEPILRNSILGTYTNFMNLLDYSAVAVPSGFTESGVAWGATLFSKAFDDLRLLNITSALEAFFKLPRGNTGFAYKTQTVAQVPVPSKYIDVVVCGAHLEGQPLNWQLVERGATLKSLTSSSAKYKLYALSDGKRPGMERVNEGGCEIEVEVWSMPQENFGSFVAGIPAPLGIGKVELKDGTWASGFICDAYGLSGAKDISEHGSWREWLKFKAQI